MQAFLAIFSLFLELPVFMKSYVAVTNSRISGYNEY